MRPRLSPLLFAVGLATVVAGPTGAHARQVLHTWHAAPTDTTPVARLMARLSAAPSCMGGTGRSLTTLSFPVADPNVWGADGNVLGMTKLGNTLYVAGSFRSVGENSGGWVPVDAQAGEALKPFPKVAGSVYAMVADGSGGWYIGGDFTAVAGRPRSALAHVLSDGSVSDWNPEVTGSPGYIDLPTVSAIAVAGDRVYVGGAFRAIGGQPRLNLGCVDARTGAVRDWNADTHVGAWIYTLAVHDSTVFVGGTFTSIGGQAHSNCAAVDAVTGAVRPWTLDATGSVWAFALRSDTLFVAGEFGSLAGGISPYLAAVDGRTGQLLPFNAHTVGQYVQYAPLPQVAALALVGDTLYAAGNFTELGGQPRLGIGAIDLSTGEALTWAPPAFGPQPSGFPPPLLQTIAVGRTALYVGGWFETAGGSSRPFAAALDRVTGGVTPWNPKANQPLYALAVVGDTVFAGGIFSSVGDWQHRAGLAAIDLTSGAVKPWNPNPDGQVCTAITASHGRILVSGDFGNIGGQPQPRAYFAALDTLNGEALDWNPGANSGATVFMLAGDTLYAGGQFTEIGGQTRNYLAALSASTGEVLPWNPDASWPVYALARRGATVYVGGIFQQLGGQVRRGIAAVDAATGALLPWNPDTDSGVVEALLVSGNRVYVGGQFGSIGGQPRVSMAALDATTGSATPWYPQPTAWGHPTEIKTLALAGGQLYVGGVFGSISGQPRICLAAVDTSSALATDWDPGADGYVWSLVSEGNELYVGGGFTRVGGLPMAGLAAFTLPQTPPQPPLAFGLEQSFPNPAHTQGTIRYTLPISASVSLSVFDVFGRRVAMLLNHAVQAAGPHDVPVRTDQWKSGVYLYRLEAGGRSASRKMLVVR